MFAVIVSLCWMFGDASPQVPAGGTLSPLQAVMDLRTLHLKIKVYPERKWIEGEASIGVSFPDGNPGKVELDLIKAYRVLGVYHKGRPCTFRHVGHKLTVELASWRSSDEVSLIIRYEGHPPPGPSSALGWWLFLGEDGSG